MASLAASFRSSKADVCLSVRSFMACSTYLALIFSAVVPWIASVNSAYFFFCSSNVEFSSSRVLLYSLHSSLILSRAFLCVSVPLAVFCSTAILTFRSSVLCLRASWKSPCIVLASSVLLLNIVNILTATPIKPTIHPIGLVIIEAHRALRAMLHFVVIAVRMEVLAVCAVLATTSASLATVDVAVAVVSNSFFFA